MIEGDNNYNFLFKADQIADGDQICFGKQLGIQVSQQSQYYQSLSKKTMNLLNLLTQTTSILNFNLTSTLHNYITPNILREQKPTQPQHKLTEQLQPKARTLPQKEEGELGNQVELFTKQQQLINQYMHLNIQLLSKKLQNIEHIDKINRQEDSVSLSEVKSLKKKIKKINHCGHPEKEHYAKGMCNNCYHKFGRNKKPWNCSHNKLYANGMCQNCYINSYNRKRREGKQEQKPEESAVASVLKIEAEDE